MKNTKILFYAEVMFFFLSSLSILAISFVLEPQTGQLSIFTYVFGGVFWFGILAGLTLHFIVSHKRKLYLRKGKLNVTKRRLPFITFLSGKIAAIIDIAMAASIIGFVLSMFVFTNNMAQTILLFSAVFFFEMHALFNSENFGYVSNKSYGGFRNE